MVPDMVAAQNRVKMWQSTEAAIGHSHDATLADLLPCLHMTNGHDATIVLEWLRLW